MSTLFPRRAFWSVVAASLVLVVYLSVLSVMPKHVFWSPDEGARFIELQSMRWQNGLSYALPYPGQYLDPGLRFFPDVRVYPVLGADGTIRFPWPIWFPLLSRGPFAMFGITGIYLVPLLSGWLVAVACGVLSRKLGSQLAPATILLVGLASPIFFYSLTFWEHTLATLLALLSVLAVIRADCRASSLLVAVPLLVIATMLRLEMVALVAALPMALLICNLRAPRSASSAAIDGGASSTSLLRQRVLLLAGLGLIIALAAAWVLALPARHLAFVKTGPFWVQEGLPHLLRFPKGLVEVVINTSRNEGPAIYLRWAAVTFGAAAVTILAAFVRRVRLEAALLLPALLVIFAYSVLLVFSSQPHRALHGIIPVAPYVVVAGYVLPQAWRRRQRPQLLVSLLATLYLLTGVAAILTFYMDRVGLNTTLEWGQRYLITLYPLLATLAVLAVSEYWQSARPAKQRLAFGLLVGALISVGIQQQVRGLRMLYENREKIAVWDKALRVRGPVVTDVWWLPTAVAQLFTTSDMFVVLDRAELDGWLAHVRQHGVRTFTFVSLRPLRDGGSWQQPVRLLESEAYPGGLYLSRFEVTRDESDPLP